MKAGSVAGTRPPVVTARILAQAVLIALAIGMTTTLYAGFFAGWDFLPRLVAVAVVASALATAVAVLGLRTLPTMLACAAGFAITALPAVLPGTLRDGLPGTLTLHTGWRALTGGWAAMLSIAAPAPDSPQMLMTPAVITWVAGFLAVTLALRTRSVLGPAAILVCAQAIGLMFASNQPAAQLPQAGALVVLLLLLTLIRAGRAGARRASLARAAAVRAALMAAVTGAALIGAVVSEPVDTAQRFNPRSLLTSPLHLEEVLNPLSEVREQLRLSAPRTLFTVTLTGARVPVGLIQTVALESFDGSQWTSRDSFRVAGPVLAAGPADHAAVTLTEHVAMSTLTGPYLPVAGWPAEIDASLGPGALIGFDPDSGTLVADAASLAGGSYTVTASAQPTYASLADATAGRGALFAPDTQLPPVPATLAALASQLTAAARTPYAKLTAINDYLRKLPISLNAAPGDSYGALVRLLTASNPRGQAGDADQHASAFAILARIERIPARVVVGYRLPVPAGSGRGSRTYTLTTADAYAWAQAYFQGYGWISFDPTNTRHTVSLPPVVHVPEPPSAPPRGIKQPTVRKPAPGRPAPRSPHRLPAPGTGSRPASWPVPPQVAIPVLVLLLSGALAVTMARRAVRRRRRHGGSPAMSAVGAWDEVIDRLADAGVAIAASQTALELAARASQQKPARPSREQRALALAAPFLCELAAIATEAAYSQTPPSARQVERAWQLEGDLSKALYGGWRAPYRAAHWAIPLPRAARRQ